MQGIGEEAMEPNDTMVGTSALEFEDLICLGIDHPKDVKEINTVENELSKLHL